MKKPVLAIIGMAAAMVMTGCSGVVYRVSESAPSPAYPQQAPRRPAMRNPTVVVNATASDAKSARLAASLRAAVEGDLAARGFDVVARRKSDSVVSLQVSRQKVASLADWRVYDGTAMARVTDVASGRLVASESFKARGQRALDEAKAEAGVKDALAGQVSRWLQKKLPARKVPLPPDPPQPGHMAVAITLAPAKPGEDLMKALRVQERFMDYVAAKPGVVSCVLAKEDPALRRFTFHVVYDPRLFPGGLLNKVVLEGPRLGESVRLEIVR